MSFRKRSEAGNQGRATVIEAICWTQRMHLGAGSRPGGTAGDIQSRINLPAKQEVEFRAATTAERGLCLQAQEVSKLTLSKIGISRVMLQKGERNGCFITKQQSLFYIRVPERARSQGGKWKHENMKINMKIQK